MKAMEHMKREEDAKVGLKEGELVSRVIGCAIEVHKTLGPGLLESAYESCLCRELMI